MPKLGFNPTIVKFAMHFYVCGRSSKKGKSKEKSKIQSKSCSCSNIECYYYHKRGHMKKDLRQWKNEKGKEKKNGSKKEEKEKFSLKIEQINSLSKAKEGDILLPLA